MNVQDIIGVRTSGGPTLEAGDDRARQAAFVTPQSLSTFPAASGVVFVIWSVLKSVWPTSNEPWVALLIALFVGALIFLVNLATTEARPRGLMLLSQAGVATVNAFLLAASALGISIVTGSSSAGSI